MDIDTKFNFYNLNKDGVLRKESIDPLGNSSQVLILSYHLSQTNNQQQLLFNSQDLVFYVEVTLKEAQLIDEELSKLEIEISPPGIEIQIEYIRTIKLVPSFFIGIMSSSVIKAAAYIIICAGLIALITALITLIPVIAATLQLINLTTTAMALKGSILFTIGAVMALSAYYCQKMERNKITETEVTIKQVGDPNPPKLSLSPEVKMIVNRFFPPKEEGNNDQPTYKPNLGPHNKMGLKEAGND